MDNKDVENEPEQELQRTDPDDVENEPYPYSLSTEDSESSSMEEEEEEESSSMEEEVDDSAVNWDDGEGEEEEQNYLSSSSESYDDDPVEHITYSSSRGGGRGGGGVSYDELREELLSPLREPVIQKNESTVPPIPEYTVSEIPELCGLGFKRLERKPIVLAYEFSKDLFVTPEERDEFLSIETLESLRCLTVSKLIHEPGDRGDYSHKAKMVLMLLARVCTIGMDHQARDLTKDANSFSRTKANRKFTMWETGQEVEITRDDLFTAASNDNPVRYEDSFCTHLGYAKMLIETGTTPAFKLIDDTVVSQTETAIPDVIYNTLEEARMREEGEDDTPPLSRTVTRDVVNRTIRRITQFSVTWELLVDNAFDVRGYRLRIHQNDPAINLGRNLHYVFNDNRGRFNSRERAHSLYMDSPECFGNILPETYGSFLRLRGILPPTHPINQLPTTEVRVEPHVYHNNPLHIAHIFHPFFCIVRNDLVPGVCPAQRDPRNYFDCDGPGAGSCGPIGTNTTTLKRYLSLEVMRNAVQHLPAVKSTFPFPELVSSMSFSELKPSILWNKLLPRDIKKAAVGNASLIRPMQAMASRMTINPFIGGGGGGESSSEEPFLVNVDIRNEMNYDWDSMIRRAAEHQQAVNRGDLIRDDLTTDAEFVDRRAALLDPLGYLGIDEAIKAKFYDADELLQFRSKATQRIKEIQPSDYPTSNFAYCQALSDVKLNLLRHLERKEQQWVMQEEPKIPASYAAGLRFEKKFTAEEMWPEGSLCVRFSDSGNRMSLWANFIIHLFDSLSELFLLNEGEARFLAIRTLASRNSALYEDAEGIGSYNQLLHGKSGVGKSYPVECITHISAPGHANVVTDFTMNSFQTDTNHCYEWLIFHELPTAFFTGGEGGKGKGGGKGVGGSGEDSVLKMMLTSGFTKKSRAHFEDGKATTVTSASRAKVSITGITNDNIKNMSPAMLQRLCVDAVSVSENNISNAELSAEEHIAWNRPNREFQSAHKKRLAYWTNWLPHKVERRIGIFQDVNMDVYNILMPSFARFMKDKYGVEIGVRKQKQIRNACRSMVIIYAVYAHFMTEVSRTKGQTSSGTFRRMQSQDFLGVENHMVFSEEMFVTMMSAFHRIILPSIECEVMEALVTVLKRTSLIHPPMVDMNTEATFQKFALQFNKYVTEEERERARIRAVPEPVPEPVPTETPTLPRRELFHVPSADQVNSYRQQLSRANEFRERARGRVPDEWREQAEGYVASTTQMEEGEGAPTSSGTRRAGPSANATHLADQARENPSSTLFDQNFVYVTQSMSDMVTMVKSAMTNKYPDSLIYSVLYSFASKTVMVNDMNRPGKKITTKVLSYQEMMKRSSGGGGGGGYGSHRGITRRQGAWFLSTRAPFEHFPDIQIERDLKEFIQRDISEPATYITLLPYENKPGYLSILKTIDIEPVQKPMTRINPLPPNESWNATVHNRCPTETGKDPFMVPLVSTMGSHDMDDHPDIIAFVRHYSECGIPTTLDMSRAHYMLSTPLFMAWKSDRYRSKNMEHFGKYPIIERYPSEKIDEVKKNEAIKKKHKEKEKAYMDSKITGKQYHNQMCDISISRAVLHQLRPKDQPDGLDEEDMDFLKRLPPRKRMTDYNPYAIDGSSTTPLPSIGPVSRRDRYGDQFVDSIVDQSMDAADVLSRSDGRTSSSSLFLSSSSSDGLYGHLRYSMCVDHLPSPNTNVVLEHRMRRRNDHRSNSITIGDFSLQARYSGESSSSSTHSRRRPRVREEGEGERRHVRRRTTEERPFAAFSPGGRPRHFGQ
jgi:hypothetical protein